MTRTIVAAVFAFLILIAADHAVAADRVQAGQWETSMTGLTPQPIVSRYCITAADAKLMSGNLASVRKYVEQSTAAAMKGRCAVKNVELNDNRTIVTIACGKTEVVSTTTYFGNRYESTSSNGTAMKGKRLAACP